LIQTSRPPGGHRLYDISSLIPNPSIVLTPQPAPQNETQTPEKYLYARVSSKKQTQDLERQITLLQHRYTDHRLVTDIGSGINFKRPGLRTLLERSRRGLVKEIVFTHRDRLCRFAYDLLSHIFTLNGTALIVVFADTDSSASGLKELSEDILAINTVFVCRMQGRRAAEYRRARKEKETQARKNFEEGETGHEGLSDEESEDSPLSEQYSEESVTTMDGVR